MAKLQPVRGTHDLLPDDARRHRHVEQTAFAVAEKYGYGEIMTPILEFTEVFSRTLGETSDVVTKEMYTFERSGESLTLRPEGTAGVARAFISNGLAQSLPLKLFYRGPMFRYERPQKGRQRQFHQVGVEFLGVDSPLADVEILAMAWQFLTELGLGGNVRLEINSLGTPADRIAYADDLRAHFGAHKDRLSEDSKVRLDKNPMRILDSKDEGDKELVASAPLITERLTEGRGHFDAVLAGLDRLGLPYTVNPRLVRGLDYYCHTAFEFVTTDLGSQGTVLAGGRYDGLVGMMGGPATPGIGWAAGVERLALLAGDVPQALRPIAVIPMGDDLAALDISQALRRAGQAVHMGYSGNMKKRLERANKANARFAVILGQDEAARGAATVRDLDTGEQSEVALTGLVEHLSK
jgi:histidyl-tRNA synthetase